MRRPLGGTHLTIPYPVLQSVKKWCSRCRVTVLEVKEYSTVWEETTPKFIRVPDPQHQPWFTDLKMFTTRVLRVSCRNFFQSSASASASSRAFSTLPSRYEPKSWTPVPFITETIVSYPNHRRSDINAKLSREVVGAHVFSSNSGQPLSPVDFCNQPTFSRSCCR